MNFFNKIWITFKNKAICIRRKIFIFFSLKKKNEMAQGRGRIRDVFADRNDEKPYIAICLLD